MMKKQATRSDVKNAIVKTLVDNATCAVGERITQHVFFQNVLWDPFSPFGPRASVWRVISDCYLHGTEEDQE